MHIHVLGICGTFMGSLAVLAKELGHRVTGSDANVYPHEHPTASPGHRVDAGLRSSPPGAGAGPGSDRQRPVARQSGGGACPEQGPALRFRPAVAGRPRAARTLGAGGGRYPRQDHHHQHARLGPGARRHEPGLPDRRGAAELRGFGAPGRYAVLRGRGRRVRQRLLRQALEVRPLPPAHGDPGTTWNSTTRISSSTSRPSSGSSTIWCAPCRARA